MMAIYHGFFFLLSPGYIVKSEAAPTHLVRQCRDAELTKQRHSRCLVPLAQTAVQLSALMLAGPVPRARAEAALFYVIQVVVVPQRNHHFLREQSSRYTLDLPPLGKPKCSAW